MMSSRFSFAVFARWLLRLALCAAAAHCLYDCSTTICDPCLDEAIPVDIIFVVDGSATMEPIIRGVAAGLSTFAAEIEARDISPRYFVVMIGYTCYYENIEGYAGTELLLNGTSDKAELIDVFNRMTVGSAVEGLHMNHGGWEPTMEAIQMSLGAARATNAMHSTRYGDGAAVALRGGDTRTLIVAVTDEPDDRPWRIENRPDPVAFPGMESGCENPAYQYWSYANEPANFMRAFPKFINMTYEAVAAKDAVLIMFVDCPSDENNVCNYQYGNLTCDNVISTGELWNGAASFNATETVACLERSGAGLSLQGQLLSSGYIARAYSTSTLIAAGGENGQASLDLVNSIMEQAVDYVAVCDVASAKRSVGELNSRLYPCKRYRCDTVLGCQERLTCAPNCVDQCGIAAFGCYANGDAHPDQSCTFCNPTRSRTQWTGCHGNSFTTCTIDVCDPQSNVCEWEAELCDAACGKCAIDGACYGQGEQNPLNSCLICNAVVSFDSWTRVCEFPTPSPTAAAAGAAPTPAAAAGATTSAKPMDVNNLIVCADFCAERCGGSTSNVLECNCADNGFGEPISYRCTGNSIALWLILVIVIGFLLFIGCLVFIFAAFYSRTRKKRRRSGGGGGGSGSGGGTTITYSNRDSIDRERKQANQTPSSSLSQGGGHRRSRRMSPHFKQQQSAYGGNYDDSSSSASFSELTVEPRTLTNTAYIQQSLVAPKPLTLNAANAPNNNTNNNNSINMRLPPPPPPRPATFNTTNNSTNNSTVFVSNVGIGGGRGMAAPHFIKGTAATDANGNTMNTFDVLNTNTNTSAFFAPPPRRAPPPPPSRQNRGPLSQ